MLYVTKRMSFSSSHRLFNPEFNDEMNEKVFDKCNNPNGHGHNYILEVTVAGQPAENTGYVIDLKILKKIIIDNVVDKVDHKYLNLDVDFMKGIIPSAENLAVMFWRQLEDKIKQGKLYSVKLYETESSWVEYKGEHVNIKKFDKFDKFDK